MSKVMYLKPKTEDKGQVSQPVLKPVNPLWNNNVTPSPVIPRVTMPTTAPVVPRLQLPQATTNRIQTMKESALEPQKPTLRIPFNYKDSQQGNRLLTAEAQQIARENTPSVISGALGGLGATFGIRNTPEQEAYLRQKSPSAFKLNLGGTATIPRQQGEEAETMDFGPKRTVDVSQYDVANLGGQIAGQVAGYGLVNKLIQGSGIGLKITEALAKKVGKPVAEFATSQGAQLLADAIIQAPVETFDAITNDKSTSDDVKQIMINRGIDLAFNSGLGALEILKNKRVVKALADAGVPEKEFVQAIETNDQQAIESIKNRINIKGKEYEVKLGEGQGSIQTAIKTPSLKVIEGQKLPSAEYSLGKRTDNLYTPTQPKDVFSINDRATDTVGDKTIKAYQVQNEEVKPYFKKMATELLSDMEGTLPGGRSAVWSTELGQWVNTSTKRQSSELLGKILDETTDYAKVKKALERIIEGKGAESNATSKRIELIIDDALSQGYKTYDGVKIKPNQEYINAKALGEFEATAPPIKIKSPLPKRTLKPVPIVKKETSIPKLNVNPFTEKRLHPFKQHEKWSVLNEKKKQFAIDLIKDDEAMTLRRNLSKEGDFVIYHPSTKEKGYQLTYFKKGEPVSDSQFATKKELAERLYDDGYGIPVEKQTKRLELPKLQKANMDQAKPDEKLYRKSASMEQEQPKSLESEYTLFKEERKVKSPKETSDGKMKFRQTIHNSLMESQVDEEIKQIKRDNPSLYKELENEKTWEDAYDSVSKDSDAVEKSLASKESLNSAQESAEYIALIHKASNDKDITKAIRLSEEFAEKATRSGQAIQAISMLAKTTPEGKLLQAVQVQRAAEKGLKESDPFEHGKFKEESDKVKKVVDDAKKEVETDVVDAVKKDKRVNDIVRKKKQKELESPEQMLADKINSALTKEVELKDRDLIKEMVQALYKKAKPNLGIEPTLKPNLNATKLADSVVNRQEYARVWQASKGILEGQLSPDLFKQIDDFITKGVRPVFDEKTLDSLIKQSFKDSNMTLDSLVRKFATEQITDRNTIKKNIVDNLGLTGSDADYLATFIENKLKESIKTKKEAILKSMFPEVKVKTNKPSTFIQDFVNLGGLENANYKNRFIEKLPSEIKKVLKSANLKVDDIVRLSRESQANVSDSVINDILRKLNVDVKYADEIRDTADKAFRELSEARKKSIVDAMLKERKKPVVKTTKQRLEELYNLDALNDLTREKYKLPTLSNEEAKWIVDEMENVQKLTGREKEIALAKVDQFIANKIPATFGDKLRALRNITLLGNPKTILVRNPFGNTIFSGLENVAQIPSGLTDAMVSKMLKSQRQTKLLPDIGSQLKGFQKGVKLAWEDIINNVDTSPTRGGAELPRNKKIFEAAWLNKANNWLGAALQMGDRPFYQAAYEARLKELKELQPNAKAEDLEKLAHEFGLERVFQNQGDTAKALQKIKGGLNDLGNYKGFGVGDIAIPFSQTPSNILAKGVQYTPLGLIRVASTGYELFGKKNLDMQKQFTDAVGRLFTGGSIIALGYKMAKDGTIKGKEQSKSSKEKKLNVEAGEQQYSVKIGDTWHSFSWAQPTALLLAIGADYYKAGESEEDVLKKIEKGLISSGDTILKEGLLRGLTNLFGGQSPTASIADTLKQSPSQLAPTLVSQVSQFADPLKREYDRSVTGSIQRKSPFRTGMPYQIDLWGQPVKEQQGRKGFEKAFDIFLNPALKSEATKDPTTKELYNLFKRTKESDIIPYKEPELDDTKLREFKIEFGTRVKPSIDRVIGSTQYKLSTDEYKVKLLRSAINSVYDSVIKKYKDKK